MYSTLHRTNSDRFKTLRRGRTTISHYWRRLYASRIFRICWSLKFEFWLFATWGPFAYHPASSDSCLLSSYSRKMLNLFPEVCNSRVCITNDDRNWCGTNWFYQINTRIKTCQSHVFQAGISYIAFRSLEVQLPKEPASWTAMTRQGAQHVPSTPLKCWLNNALRETTCWRWHVCRCSLRSDRSNSHLGVASFATEFLVQTLSLEACSCLQLEDHWCPFLSQNRCNFCWGKWNVHPESPWKQQTHQLQACSWL